jgi:hypothetical protein
MELSRRGRRLVLALATIGLLLETGGLAMAQNYRGQSCSQLWYARNAIYADAGYCFKTARAIRVFGRGCFPPFGRLSPWQQDEIDRIRYWERVKGCS